MQDRTTVNSWPSYLKEKQQVDHQLLAHTWSSVKWPGVVRQGHAVVTESPRRLRKLGIQRSHKGVKLNTVTFKLIG